MKLEIKHLTPYLPYGLKFLPTHYNRDKKIDTLYYLSTIYNSEEFGVNGYTSKYIKPILRPLSNLTKEIEMPFGKIVPMEWMFKEAWTEWDGESDCPLFMRHTYLCASGKVFPKFLPFWIVEQLAEMHFDLFELIEKGLALSYNDLKK